MITIIKITEKNYNLVNGNDYENQLVIMKYHRKRGRYYNGNDGK